MVSEYTYACSLACMDTPPCGGGRFGRRFWITFSAGRPIHIDKIMERAYGVCSKCGWGLLRYFFFRLSFLALSPFLSL